MHSTRVRTKSPQRPRPSCMAPHQSAAMVIHSRQCGTSDCRNYFGGGGVGEAPWQSAALGLSKICFSEVHKLKAPCHARNSITICAVQQPQVSPPRPPLAEKRPLWTLNSSQVQQTMWAVEPAPPTAPKRNTHRKPLPGPQSPDGTLKECK